MRLTFPTFLTFTRIGLIPFLVYAIVYQLWPLATILFLTAAITDMLDGYLARLWDEETEFGACLDPVADKLLIISCYATLVFFPVSELPLPLWFLLVVLLKELSLLAGAFYFAIVKGVVRIRPTYLGKLTMVVQSALVIWLLLCSIFDWMPIKTFRAFLDVAIFFVMASLAQYGYSALTATRRQRGYYE
ncbi:MAG: CDP-alcohol phosphatidyltransferase family protein [Candidatus Dependentiae bacterium]|nr:CDP-alcohol phosphatidyltransferase family protein [Candidatus Dependentiae bacterium]